MNIKLQSITPEIEKNIVEIARVSSPRKNKTEYPEKLLTYLINNKHWSPFEHGSITFEIETSKAISIQLLRHRSFTFQEFSQRYAKVTKFEPIELRKQSTDNRQSSKEIFNPEIMGIYSTIRRDIEANTLINNVLKQIKDAYEGLIDSGVAKECARMILPMCSSTTIFMTGNVRSWIHFIQIRDDEHAQKEIQLVAKEIKKIFKKELPIISSALKY